MVKNVVTPARSSVRKLVLFSLSLNIRSSIFSEDGLEELEELIKEGKNLTEKEIIEKGIGFSRNSLIREIIIYYDESCTEEQIKQSKLKYNNKVIDVKESKLDKAIFEYLDWTYPTTLMSDIDFINEL